MGLTTTTAITLFMRAVIRERKIPFEISAEDESIK
ncbi:MAG: type II toxin-antitoxin system RelB/DinJ family antitoxin [Lachnospiraceae bacterium]|nr:type II toxin-antitoxin system RelB/DinJ family antitoxin [Lachnospiraceae bacterium]